MLKVEQADGQLVLLALDGFQGDAAVRDARGLAQFGRDLGRQLVGVDAALFDLVAGPVRQQAVDTLGVGQPQVAADLHGQTVLAPSHQTVQKTRLCHLSVR